MIAALAALAPILSAQYGITGVAMAWFAANAPFGLWAAWRLTRLAQEVKPHVRPIPVDRTAHVE